MTHPFWGKFAVVGLGFLAGRLPGQSARALETEAVRLAIEDAGLRPQDVDGAINTRIESGAGESRGWTDSYAASSACRRSSTSPSSAAGS